MRSYKENMPFEAENHKFANDTYYCPPNERYYACLKGCRYGLKMLAEFVLNHDIDTVIETCENIINNYEED